MSSDIKKANLFTSGPIFLPLIKFAVPILGALILQSLYSAVDLWVVGQYGVTADISAVATGSQLIMTITNIIIGLAVGTSVMIGQNIGAGNRDAAGDVLALRFSADETAVMSLGSYPVVVRITNPSGLVKTIQS